MNINNRIYCNVLSISEIARNESTLLLIGKVYFQLIFFTCIEKGELNHYVSDKCFNLKANA